MALDQQLQNDMKTAMRAKDTLRLNTVRLMRAALQAETTTKRQRQLDALVTQRKTKLEEIDPADIPPAEPLNEDEMLKVLAREVKKRHDSVEMYLKGGRDELAAQEQAEIAVLQGYLPQQLSADDLRPMIASIIAEVGATSKADLRKVMPVVMSRLRDKADGRTLNQVVGELLP